MSSTYQSRREYMRAYQRKWIAERRESYFRGKQCVRCGSRKNLELDHIDPLTKETHAIWSWSKVRRDEELSKTQVLCSLCHLEKTKEDLRKMDVNAHLRIIDPPGMAWCCEGEHFALVSEFTKDRTKRRGVQTECRLCRSEARSRRRHASEADTVGCASL